MSAVIETFIICDGKGGACGESHGVDNRNSTAKEHRESARMDGWVYSNGKDYCPNCKKKKTPTMRSINLKTLVISSVILFMSGCDDNSTKNPATEIVIHELYQNTPDTVKGNFSDLYLDSRGVLFDDMRPIANHVIRFEIIK